MSTPATSSCIALLIVSFANAQPALAQRDIAIDEFVAKKSSLDGQLLTVEGVVERWLEAEQGDAKFYRLRDNYQNGLPVRTLAELPDLGASVRVTGVVQLDPNTKDYYFDERTRESDAGVNPIAVGAGALGVLLIGGAAFLLRPRRSLAPLPLPSSPAAHQPGVLNGAASVEPLLDTKTVKIQRDGFSVHQPLDEATHRVVGGRWSMKSPSGTESFRLFSPTVTVSRGDGPPLTHIRIDHDTVSRNRHATLTFAAGEWSVINQSETNPVLVDGRELGMNEAAAVKNGTVVEIGAVKLSYSTVAKA